MRYIEIAEASHPLVRPAAWQTWGASHGYSQSISGEAARLADIGGYRYGDNPDRSFQRLAKSFLKAIANSPGSSEPLYHGFQDRKRQTFHIGQIIDLPLVAASGDLDDSAGYGINRRPEDGPVVVFEFPTGTPMAGYKRWNKADAEDFGHIWAEAIIGGRFRVVGQREQHRWDWSDQPKITVVTLEPVAIFDPSTRQWVNR